MIRSVAYLSLDTIVFCGLLLGTSIQASSQRTAQTSSVVSVNKTAPIFEIRDIRGNLLNMKLFKGALPVFVFVDTECPILEYYSGRMRALNSKHAKKGLRIIYVFVEDKSKNPAIKAIVDKQKLPFAIHDYDRKITRLFKATYTMESFLFDRGGVLRYHGRIDDSVPIAKVKDHTLENAIQSVLHRKTITKPEVPGIGCSLSAK